MPAGVYYLLLYHIILPSTIYQMRGKIENNFTVLLLYRPQLSGYYALLLLHRSNDYTIIII